MSLASHAMKEAHPCLRGLREDRSCLLVWAACWVRSVAASCAIPSPFLVVVLYHAGASRLEASHCVCCAPAVLVATPLAGPSKGAASARPRPHAHMMPASVAHLCAMQCSAGEWLHLCIRARATTEKQTRGGKQRQRYNKQDAGLLYNVAGRGKNSASIIRLVVHCNLVRSHSTAVTGAGRGGG